MNISVIIPSFKPQEYLYTCLKSLEQQVFEKSDFEVVVVLNGCKEPFYSRIRSFIQKSMLNVNLIQTDEAGVSNARNIALDCVKGKYVTFLDDDDWISPSYLSELYDLAETGCIPLSNIVAFEDQTDKKLPYYITDVFNRCHMNSRDYGILQIRSFMSVPCCKMIRRDIIGKRRFNKRFKNGEDSLFMFLLSDQMIRFRFTSPNAIYYRRVRSNSAVTRRKTLREKMLNTLSLCMEYSRIYCSNILRYNFFFYLTRVLASVRNVVMS